MTNDSLYSISDKYMQLLDKEEYSAEDLDLLQEIADNFNNKAISVAAYILNQQLKLAGICDAAKRMQERASKLSDKIDTLNNYLKDQLAKVGVTEILDHPEFEIKVKTNPPKVEILDEKLIPDKYFVVKKSISPDKKAIKSAIDEGLDIQGVKLVQETRLQIK